MVLLYMDESGSTGTDYDNKQQPIFVLASICVEDTKWHELNNLFNTQKTSILPILKEHEIHTNELFNSSKKSIFNQYDWHDNFKTLEKLVDLIVNLDICAYYIAIDKKEFKKSINKTFNNAIKIDPYIYSFRFMYDNISYILHANKKRGIIFLDDILNIPEQLHNIYPVLFKNNNTMIEEALFLDSQHSNFIQIADVFAFYIDKYFSITRGYKKYSDFKNDHCLKMFNKLSEKINPLDSAILDEYFPLKNNTYFL